jgi:predicted alpha/beta hydrolase family esterase
MDKKNIKIILAPGNGGGNPKRDNWFPYAKTELEALGLQVIASEFPDNILAREAYWVPFIRDELGADERTIVIGHSSGAIAALRLAEETPLLGSVLVGGYHTDLGIENEILAGYFNRPWDWASIKKNQQWVVQFNSSDDPWIPIAEARYLHEQLQTDYYEFNNQGHFGGDYLKLEFPELIAAVRKNLKI